MRINLKDLYDFNKETGLVDKGFIKVNSKNGFQNIEAIDITAKNSIKLKIKTTNFEISISPKHLLFNQDWIKSKKLSIGDYIDTINGYEKIIDIKEDIIPEDLYDIQVLGSEFFANGIRSHNSSFQQSFDFSIFGIVRGKNGKRVPQAILPNRINKNLETEYPDVPQITWDLILSFIYTRFQAYRRQKSAHVQWDECGKLLWDKVRGSRNIDEYIDRFDIQ